MQDYNRNKGPGGWKGGNDRFSGGFGGQNGGDRPMFKATCATCGNSCEVPFKPNGSKPIFCRDCFKKEGNGGESRSFERNDAPRGGFGFEEKRLFQATCATCGDTCEVPFKPNGSKPVYCRNCFKKEGGGESRSFERKAPEFRSAGGDQNAEQFRALNAKLDALLKLLTPASSAKAVEPVKAKAPAPAAPEAPKAIKAEKPSKKDAPKKKAVAKKKK